MHRTVAERLGPRTALRYKLHGLYHDISWSEYRRRADHAASAMIARGIRPGDRISLLSENRPEWLIADIAILAAGAVTVPIHAPSTHSQVGYQIRHSESRFAIVSNADQAEKVLASLDDSPQLELLITFESVDTHGRIDHVSWPALELVGWREGDYGKGLIGKREEAVDSDDLASIIYTSGTTGDPKGVMLTHGNFLSNVEATLLGASLDETDELLSWLPYSHIYARTVDHYMAVMGGATVCHAESPETLMTNLAEIQPTCFCSVPRFYEKVWGHVEKLSPEARAVALKRVFGPRMRRLSSGGAPLPAYVAEGFLAAGLPLYEGYGLTESSPVISFNAPETHRLGSVGKSIPGVEVAIAPDGEILTRGPHVMRGYWKDEQATRETIVDGWLHTGDVGRLDPDGYLSITGRKKDLIITSGGKNIAPGALEHLLVRDEFIDQAVVCGDGRPFVAALIVPNFERLRAALGPGVTPWATEGDLIVDDAPRAAIMERVEQAMSAVSKPERVRDFLLLKRPFQLESEEITSTMKVRRRFVISKFQAQLDTLYTARAGSHFEAVP